jgi:hypothetical protein
MGRLFGGGALLLVALFMIIGFLRSDVDPSATATLIALLIGAGIPAGAGAALIVGQLRKKGVRAQRIERLRQESQLAEVLRLAAARAGRLTVVEVVTELAIPPETAKETLDVLMTRDLADIEVTESGVLVYVFRDVRLLQEKLRSKGILDD